MKNVKHSATSFSICLDCNGNGKKSRKLRKQVRLHYQFLLEEFEKSNKNETAPLRPKAPLYTCPHCVGTGLKPAVHPPKADVEHYPHLAIIGGGIAGIALAVACLHRGIPFTLYERDSSFDVRSQGYGLTLQQASKAIEGFGIFKLSEGVISTRQLVHTTAGVVIAEWGMRKWLQAAEKTTPKRSNIHIARQSLRSALLDQLGGTNAVQWDHKVIGFQESDDGRIEITLQNKEQIKTVKADLLVGADGIRSVVRSLLLNKKNAPLRYLDCMVILGICALSKLKHLNSTLLDSATVFQTANGNERIYIMPYDSNSVMWQLSFPMAEDEAKALSLQGTKALKDEAILRTQWHKPIPQILAATLEAQVSGYPVYDREVLQPELLEKAGQVTLIGDAAHPMSPFKGQGANQALLDALALARTIATGCKPKSNWKETGVRKNVLTGFEAEMIQRSTTKVKDSAEAAQFLHSETVLYEGDEPRGRVLKRDV